MKELYTEIEIQASPEQVWQALTDLERFSQWNSFIRSAKGELKVSSQVEIFVHPPGSSEMMFRPRILKVEPNRELRWLGKLLISRLFESEHAFTIELSAENKVRFQQMERYTGLLVPFLWKSIDVNVRQGFNEMNNALKNLVESANNNY